ncbi:FAR1-related protein, partial [Striga asiatica]
IMNENEIIEEPTLGMVFRSQEEAYSYYSNYGIQKGFGVMKRSSKRGDDGVVRYFTFACVKNDQKKKSTGKNSFAPRLSTKTGCKAKIRLTLKDVNFIVSFDESTREVNCVCRLFEFRGILCRHIMSMLIGRKINERKDLKRRYTLVRIGYNPLSQQIQQCEKICKAFHEVAIIAADDEEKYELVMKGIRELKLEISSDELIHEETVQAFSSQSQNYVEQQKVLGGENKVLSPVVTRGKGRPATKRKILRLEVVVQKLKKKNQNKKLKETKAKKLKCTKAPMKTLEANSIFGSTAFKATFDNEVNQVSNFGEHYMLRPPDPSIYPNSIQLQEKGPFDPYHDNY